MKGDRNPGDARTPTWRARLESAALWGAGVSWLVPLVSLQISLYRLGMTSWELDWLSRVFIRGQLVMLGVKWNAWVHEDIRPEEPYFFLQNHVNHFDFVTCYNATPHFKQGIELESHFKYPFYGWFMKSRGTIPVPADRTGRSDAIREHARRELDAGRSILAFPEGTRSPDGRVGPFRTGIFRIARDLGAKVVPVSVTGMHEVMKKGSYMLKGGQPVDVFYDAPVSLAGLSDAEVDATAAAVRHTIARRVDDYYEKRFGLPRVTSSATTSVPSSGTPASAEEKEGDQWVEASR